MGSLKREPHTYNAVQHISQTSVGKSVLVDARLQRSDFLGNVQCKKRALSLQHLLFRV